MKTKTGLCIICGKETARRSPWDVERLGLTHAILHVSCQRKQKQERIAAVLDLYGRGWPSIDIAADLGIARSTVMSYLNEGLKAQEDEEYRQSLKRAHDLALPDFLLNQRLPTGFLAELADGWLPDWATSNEATDADQREAALLEKLMRRHDGKSALLGKFVQQKTGSAEPHWWFSQVRYRTVQRGRRPKRSEEDLRPRTLEVCGYNFICRVCGVTIVETYGSLHEAPVDEPVFTHHRDQHLQEHLMSNTSHWGTHRLCDPKNRQVRKEVQR
mgnify:CR=1 FL=1